MPSPETPIIIDVIYSTPSDPCDFGPGESGLYLTNNYEFGIWTKSNQGGQRKTAALYRRPFLLSSRMSSMHLLNAVQTHHVRDQIGDLLIGQELEIAERRHDDLWSGAGGHRAVF